MKISALKRIFRAKGADISLLYIAAILLICVISGIALYGGKEGEGAGHIALFYNISDSEAASLKGVSLAKAERDMDELMQANYASIHQDQAGERKSPNKAVMLVFGYSRNEDCDGIIEILQNKGLNATVVVDVDDINRGLPTSLRNAIAKGYVRICVSADTPYESVAAAAGAVYGNTRIYMAGERLSMTNMLIAGELGAPSVSCMLSSNTEAEIEKQLAAYAGFSTLFRVTSYAVINNADPQTKSEDRHPPWQFYSIQTGASAIHELLCVNCIQVTENTDIIRLISPHTEYQANNPAVARLSKRRYSRPM